MRLDPEATSLLSDLMQEAHSENMTPNGAAPSSVAATFVSKLRHLEPFGHEWVNDVLDRLTTTGALKAAADWRRTHMVPAKTKRGKVVDLPEYAGSTRIDDAGKTKHVQVPLATMSVTAMRAHKVALERQRNTLSARISAYDAILAIAEAEGCTTAEALERIA